MCVCWSSVLSLIFIMFRNLADTDRESCCIWKDFFFLISIERFLPRIYFGSGIILYKKLFSFHSRLPHHYSARLSLHDVIVANSLFLILFFFSLSLFHSSPFVTFRSIVKNSQKKKQKKKFIKRKKTFNISNPWMKRMHFKRKQVTWGCVCVCLWWMKRNI